MLILYQIISPTVVGVFYSNLIKCRQLLVEANNEINANSEYTWMLRGKNPVFKQTMPSVSD